MLNTTPEFSELISIFRSEFRASTFKKVCITLLGVICTQGKRTVCSVLRTLNRGGEQNWHSYHRLLNRVKWKPLRCSFYLGLELVNRFSSKDAPLLFFIDETLERRRGVKIAAKGVYRDSVRSSKGHFVKSSGLRWMCCMLLVKASWMPREWALPFLTVLCPSERYNTEIKKRQHKKLTDWARQIALQVSRWFKGRKVIMIGDTSYSVIDLFAQTKDHVTWITRMRLDAALYSEPVARPSGKRGPNPKKGERLPTLQAKAEDISLEWQSVIFSVWYGESDKKMLIATDTCIWYHGGKTPIPIRWVLVKDPKGKKETVAILCTDQEMSAQEIVEDFVKRWYGEVTFQEVRAHLGVETQRQWNEKSIARSTPILMALFSIVTLWADSLYQLSGPETFSTAWYQKKHITFSDALTTVRYRIWGEVIENKLWISPKNGNIHNLDHTILNHLAFMLARAA